MGKTMKENGNRLYLNLRQLVAAMVMVLGIGIATGSAEAEDYFSWETRVDRHGKPAGIFETTPFPIIETTTDYTIKNDEYPEGKTYYLGTIYYVDGGYTGGSNDGSWEHPWTSIGTALSNLSSGNITIIVRGAHDGFDGVYNEDGLRPKSGLDDTHRFMIIGYGQERPIIKGSSVTDGVIFTGGGSSNTAYLTVQRLKIQDNYSNGIRAQSDDPYINVIDVWLYHNSRYHFENAQKYGDGNLYFLSSDNCWIFHCTSEHTYGHCFKVGDDAHDAILEWSIARECGYWDGFPLSSYYNAHPSGLDFPNGNPDDADGDGIDDRGWNMIVRYNIAHTVLFNGVQLRRTPNFSFHHNEIYDTVKFDNVADCDSHGGREQVIIHQYDSYGDFYSNIIRDPGSSNTTNLRINTWNENWENLNIYNNLIYGGSGAQILGYGQSEDTTVNIFSNSIYGESPGSLVTVDLNVNPYSLILENNVIYQAGSGNCIDPCTGRDSTCLVQPEHSYNLYYAPGGNISRTSRFVLDDLTEINADPGWQAIPDNEYNSSEAALAGDSPAIDKGTDISTLFTSSFNSASRPQGFHWDIGAYEYVSSLTGDLNSDTLVNILDIQACVNYILDPAAYSQYAAAADVNGGGVDVTDVQAIVNIILNG